VKEYNINKNNFNFKFKFVVVKNFLILSVICSILFFSCTERDYNATIEETPELEGLVSTQFTNVLSEEEALNEVNSLLTSFEPIETRTSGASSKKRTIANYYPLNASDGVTRSGEGETTESDDPLIYVVNLANEAGEEAGYVIVSGDKRANPILAITDNGALSKDDVIDNPGVILFLERAEEYYKSVAPTDIETKAIRADPEGQPSSTYTVYGEWTNNYLYGNVIAARWGQGDPYNYFCYTSTGQKAATGCTATAVAQLLYHHGYPNSYNGYTFNWNVIKNSSSYYSINNAGAADVARLMQQIGLSQNLAASYDVSATGASHDNIPRTLKNFGFAKYGSVAAYNQSTIQSSVSAGKPVLVSGYGKKTVSKKTFLGITISTTTTYSDGHVWVIDAVLQRKRAVSTYTPSGALVSTNYQYEYLVHCNWGWNGSRDGYYYSDAFNTNNGPVTRTDSPYHYQYELKMIANVSKN
jgi:hypothetical protein